MSSEQNQTQVETPEILDATESLATIERANIDMLIATAHQFPRSIKQFMADAKDMVTLDLDTAEGCYYRLERKDRNAPGGLKVIEGPSVRLLEIAASCYGNIRYGSRVLAIEDKFVVTQGVAHDLQRNVFSSSETRRRITTSSGHRFGDDMIGVTANAACSIAKRNALNGIVPRVYVNQLCELAKETARGDQKTLSERRARAIEYFTQKVGVKLPKILEKINRKGIEEITLDDIEKLNGIKTAIKEGDTTIDEEFDPKPEPTTKPLGEIIGNPEDKKPEPKTETKERTYTADERQVILKEVENLMIDHSVGESKIMLYCAEHKLSKPEQDELGSLSTATLDALRSIIPTLKKGASK